MASVVQGKCPGCKTVLVIPAEWARQSVRCQHCGMVVTAQPSAPQFWSSQAVISE